MNILITGHLGYIGSVLTSELADNGHNVTGLDTGFFKNGIKNSNKSPLFKEIIKDIRNITETDLKGIECVIHLAELSNDPLGMIDESLTYEINHKGTANLVKAAITARVSRFIYSSSCSIYGASDEFVNEDSVPNPLTAYAKCKVTNENFLLSQSSASFSPVILRNATVYGASPALRLDLVVNNLSALAFATGEIKMDSDGNPFRPQVHVKDVAQAFMRVLNAEKNAVHNQIINVGTNSGNYMIKDIASIIGQVFPRCTIKLNPEGIDKRNYKVRFDKIGKILPAFECDWDVKKGAEELKDHFEKINLTSEDLESEKYIRLKAIKSLMNSGRLNEKLLWNTI